MLRSILAVAIGFFTIGALAIGGDVLVHRLVPEAYDATGRLTSVPWLVFTQLYVGVFATGGCYLAARLAPRRPMAHALALGVLGLVFNIAGTAAQWDTAPAWYHLTALLLVLPYAWLGGRIRELELGAGAVPVRVRA